MKLSSPFSFAHTHTSCRNTEGAPGWSLTHQPPSFHFLQLPTEQTNLPEQINLPISPLPDTDQHSRVGARSISFHQYWVQPFQSGSAEGESQMPPQSCKKPQSEQAAAGNKPQCQATLLLGIKITHFPSGSRWEAEELKASHSRRGNKTLAGAKEQKTGRILPR